AHVPGAVHLRDAAIGERVGAMVAGRVGVAAHPVPADRMRFRERVELAPELGILHGLAVGRAPAVALPRVDPALDALLDVLRIEVEIDVRPLLERFERADDGGQLHPVVRRAALAAEKLLLRAAANQQRAPSAGTRVALARAVGVNDRGLVTTLRDHALRGFFTVGAALQAHRATLR